MQQLWTVLGPDGSKIVVWLGVALGLLIGVALLIWLVTKVFGRSLNMAAASGRGQPQRLAITGAFNVDRKGRKLVIVRRDNVEHLILIGGPNDVLVETGIIRAERAIRPSAQRDPADLQEAPSPPLAPAAPLAVPAPPPIAPPAAPVAPLAPPRPVMRREAPPAELPVMTPPPSVQVAMPAPKAEQPAPVKPVVEAPPAPKAPEYAALVVPQEAPQTEPAAPPPAAPRPPQDPRLSDMARRLQNVLQRPMTPATKAPAPTPAAAQLDASETIPIPLPSARKAETAPPAVVAPVTQGKAVSPKSETLDTSPIDSLEEEMARLLGRTGPDKG